VLAPFEDAQAWLVALVLLALLGGLVIILIVLRALRSRETLPAPEPDIDEKSRRELSEISARLAALEQGMARMGEALPRSVQGVGVVRYNPFPGMGSNMSFSLALLDGRANGVVLSVLTGRDGSRVYGKAVEAGTSTYPLSEEERQALAIARGKQR
jgi:uncharacterized protein DUF4446